MYTFYPCIILLFISVFDTFVYSYSFDQNKALHFTKLSQSAYCVSSVNGWNCPTCESTIHLEYIVENNGAYALQGYDSYTNSMFVSFRGSSNLENWIDDIKITHISPYNDPKIKVSKGFYTAYSYIKEEIFQNLASLSKKYNTQQVSVTGHSLGATEATLMIYDLLYNYNQYHISHFYTFGSPRVGNNNFVNATAQFSDEQFRITHYYDIVPHLPEEVLDYFHLPNEIWYTEKNNNYRICNDSVTEEDQKCSDSCAPVSCISTSDHLYYLNVTMGSAGC